MPVFRRKTLKSISLQEQALQRSIDPGLMVKVHKAVAVYGVAGPDYLLVEATACGETVVMQAAEDPAAVIAAVQQAGARLHRKVQELKGPAGAEE
ncbi:MAG: hypothetical protein GY913_21555 [Proteobacteria bacterium]|nr:hypothetical protein [Actinomycetes bacterium]MCP4919496.1 hypothetical protein [Pseudomonadota bacterium]